MGETIVYKETETAKEKETGIEIDGSPATAGAELSKKAGPAIKNALNYRERLILTNYSFGNKPDAIVIHETDNTAPSAGALNHSVYFATPGVGVSCHYVADDHEIIRLLGHTKAAWHCGKPLGKYSNSNTIGIEICVNGNYWPAWYRAALLTAALLDETGLSKVMRHKDVSGKRCPTRMINEPNLWEQFLLIVEQQRGQWKLVQGRRNSNPLTGESAKALPCDRGIVTAGLLNVRSGRGVTFPVIGTLAAGTPVKLCYLMLGWWSIDFGPNVGYVSQKYISVVRQL